MISVGNLVFLYPHEHFPFCSTASSQFLSSSCPLFSSRPCSGFHQTVALKGTCKSTDGSPSNFLRPHIYPAEEGACRKLSATGTVQALSTRLLSGFKGRHSRGKFLVKSENGNANWEDDVEEETLQTSIEKSKRVLALQKELLQKIAERRKLVATLRDDLGSSAEKIKVFNKTVDLEEDQELDNTAESIEVQNGSTNVEEENHDVSIEETSKSLFSTVAAEFLSKALASPGILPEVPVEAEYKREERDVKAEIDGHSGVEKVKAPPLAGPNVMNIIMVAAECAPWSKTGGLGDVVGALPKALARRGHRVMAVAPRYHNYREAWDTGIRMKYNVAGQDMEVGYFHGYIDGVDFVFIDNPIFHGNANDIYGGSRQDVLIRMILFCKAAVEVPWHVPCGGACYGDGNLVFIANDWHTSLLPVYLRAYYHDHGLMKYTRCVLVIHNMAHQGRGPVDDYQLLDLPAHYLGMFKLNDPIGGEHLNIFQAGLKTAHRIVAVSHGYAWECQTQEGGWGLHNVVRQNEWKLHGIVNGIDDQEWNPELDVHLKSDGYVNYSVKTLETGKSTCKSALQRGLGLPVRSEVPLIGFIGRLDQQKGVDLIADAMPWMMEQDLQLVMLGTGRRDLENMLHSCEARYYDKVRGWVGFSVKTAHHITAGADILLMPSRFEPCGLNQLYAMKYGTVPVVHAVGGLRDTVKPFDPYAESGLGWAFERAETSALINALGNALWTYRDFKQSWIEIQKRCMNQNLSWDNAAQQYEEVLVAAKYQW